MKAVKNQGRKRLTESEKGIIRRAFSKHYHSLHRSANQCSGSLYPAVYLGEANRTEQLLRKLLGEREAILNP